MTDQAFDANVSINGNLNVDLANKNEGTAKPGITFGESGSGEAISSTRVEGKDGRFGLDLFTDGKSRLFLEHGGWVGVGTRKPEQNLSVNAGLNVDQADTNEGTVQPGITFGSRSGEGISSTRKVGKDGRFGLDFFTGFISRLFVAQDGKVGVGTRAPEQNLSVNGGLNVDQADANAGGLQNGITFGSHSGEGIASTRKDGTESRWDLEFYTGGRPRMTIRQDGRVGIGTRTPYAELDVHGSIRVSGDVILTGADCAEAFAVQAAESVAPGSILVIAEDGTLRECDSAYDKCVAGVVSGAGDLRPGVVLNRGVDQSDHLPLALVGTVHCRVDASYGAIGVGDMITTSPTPGHGMRADDSARAFGAIVGKALGTLAEGQGTVRLLVGLQ